MDIKDDLKVMVSNTNNWLGEKDILQSSLDEITTLRQQVAELEGNKQKDNADFEDVKLLMEAYKEAVNKSLTLRDLEIVKLREALWQASRQLDLHEPSSTMCKLVGEALSTQFTPDHLNEWLREQVGEPVAWQVWQRPVEIGDEYFLIADNKYAKNPIWATIPLYALKESLQGS
jgi:hypothetical protein